MKPRGRSQPLTPEQVFEARQQLARIQRETKSACAYRPAPDDKPTIPVPPPDPDALRPAKRPRPPRYEPRWDDKPTAPPPPHPHPNDPRYPT